MIRLLIFDVGGVIDTFDERQYITYITKKLKLDKAKFTKTLKPMLDKMDTGSIRLTKMESILSKEFGITTSHLEWDKSFERLNALNTNVVSLINQLSKRYKIILLTNVSKSRHMVKMRGLLKKVKFDRIFASCYLGMAKPDPKIYGLVLKRAGARPNEAVFVDNLEENVRGARKVGMKAIRFTSYKSLLKRFNAMGIK